MMIDFDEYVFPPRGALNWNVPFKQLLQDLVEDVNEATAEVASVASGLESQLDTKADLVAGVLPTSQLPPLAVNETFVAANQSAMLALNAQRGDIAIRTDTGRTFVLSSDSPTTLADWKEIQAAGQVTSVAGKTGTVSLAKADVGLPSVDNTSDLAKPISTATQAALDGKSAVGHSHTASQVTDFNTAADARVNALVPAASESAAGKVELATTAETTTGTDTARAVTPAGVKAVADTKAALSHTHAASQVTDFNTAADARVNALVPAASETGAGKIEIATAAEIQAGTDTTRAVTPAGLQQLTPLTTRAGVVATATQAEVDAGSITNKFVSPSGLKNASGVIRGDDGRKYRVLAGVIRNTGSGFAWIDDSGHKPVGFSPTITQDAVGITVNYGFTATKVLALVAAPDESFTNLGYMFGSSVGLSSAVIYASDPTGFHDYVTWNGSAWTSLTGFITSTSMNGTTGLITFNHDDVGAEHQYAGIVSLRTAGANRMSQEGQSATQLGALVYPFNSSTSLKAPTTDLRFWINRQGVRKVPPSELVQPSTNIWLYGLMEVA